MRRAMVAVVAVVFAVLASMSGARVEAQTPVAEEAWCVANPSNCVMSEPFQSTSYTRTTNDATPAALYTGDQTTKLGLCNQPFNGACSISSHYGPSAVFADNFTISTDGTILGLLPNRDSSKVARFLRYNGANMDNTPRFGYSPIPLGTTVRRIAMRWYSYHSPSYEFGREGGTDCTNGKIAHSSAAIWGRSPIFTFQTYTGETNHYSFLPGGFSGGPTPSWVWPGNSSFDGMVGGHGTHPGAAFQLAGWRGKWFRHEIVVTYPLTADAQANGFDFQFFTKNVTDGTAEFEDYRFSSGCTGCLAGGGDFVWDTGGGGAYPTVDMSALHTEFYRAADEGSCVGWQGWLYAVVAKWDSNAGQRIGAASEVEGGAPPDTTPPTDPTSLVVTQQSLSRTQLNLDWTDSTDDVGVSTYRVERCAATYVAGTGFTCTNFAEVGTPSTSAYNDTGLTATTTYRYRVRARDAAGNNSGYSTIKQGNTVWPIKHVAGERFMRESNGTPWLMIGDTAHCAISYMTTAEMETYMTDRQAKGVNAVIAQTMCNEYIGQRADDSTTAALGSLTPWTNTADLATTRESYWQRFDYLVDYAAQHGIVVLLDVNETAGHMFDYGSSTFSWTDHTIGMVQTFSAWMGDRYKAWGNIIWTNGNDQQNWGCLAGSDGFCIDNATNYAAVADDGRDTQSDQYSRALSLGIKGVDLETPHLYTTQLDYRQSNSSDNGRWQPLGVLSADGAYTYYATYDSVKRAYNRTTDGTRPVMPVYLFEGVYENNQGWGPWLPTSGGTNYDFALRRQSWWALTSGAAGSIYGNESMVIGCSAPGVPDAQACPASWQNQLGANSTTANEIPYVASFFNALEWWLLEPDFSHTTLTVGYGTNCWTDAAAADTPSTIGAACTTNADCTGGALCGYSTDTNSERGITGNPNANSLTNNTYASTSRASDGSFIVAYLPTSRQVTIDMTKITSATGQVLTRWYDPSDGSFTAIGTYANTGTRNFTSPTTNSEGVTGAADDWILLLEELASPGSVRGAVIRGGVVK